MPASMVSLKHVKRRTAVVAARDRRHRLQGAQPPPLEADDLTERKERSDPISCQCALRLATRDSRVEANIPSSVHLRCIHPASEHRLDSRRRFFLLMNASTLLSLLIFTFSGLLVLFFVLLTSTGTPVHPRDERLVSVLSGRRS